MKILHPICTGWWPPTYKFVYFPVPSPFFFLLPLLLSLSLSPFSFLLSPFSIPFLLSLSPFSFSFFLCLSFSFPFLLFPFSFPFPLFPFPFSLSPVPFSFPFPLSPFPFPFPFLLSPFSFILSISLSFFPFSFILYPFPFPFPFHFSFLLSPFPFSLSFLLSPFPPPLGTYRWRNPQLWFSKKKWTPDLKYQVKTNLEENSVFKDVCREPIDGAKHPIAQVVYRWRIAKICAIHFQTGVSSSLYHPETIEFSHL